MSEVNYAFPFCYIGERKLEQAQLKPTNTFKAHRLSFYAKEAGLQREFTEEIMKAYFTDSQLISNESVLLEIIDNLNLDRDRAKEILNSEMYTGNVREDEQQAYNMGILHFWCTSCGTVQSCVRKTKKIKKGNSPFYSIL